MSELIRTESISRDYRRGRETVHALRDVTLSVDGGEFLAIVGRSGSGKTTLLQLIGCLDTPSRGSVFVDGADTGKLAAGALTQLRSKTVGFVFQQFFLLPTLTAQENVELPAMFTGAPGRVEHSRALLDKVGLSERFHHLPRELSGGEMQRVAIARALVNSPKILLADEPTGNLDSESAQLVISVFEELNRGGQTILIVTHDEELAARAHRRIHLRDGRLLID